MTVFTVTSSNWNSVAFWSGISVSSPGHTLDFSGLPSTYAIDFWPANNEIIIRFGGAAFTIGDSDHSATPDATMAGSSQLEFFTVVRDSDADGILDGGADDDSILGFGGDDTLSGHDGADTIHGGSGADVVGGGGDADLLIGDSGADTIFGNDGDDQISAGQDADSVLGGSGQDTITGGGDKTR